MYSKEITSEKEVIIHSRKKVTKRKQFRPFSNITLPLGKWRYTCKKLEHCFRLQQDFEISMIKCENLLEYCGTVSERRIVDVAAFVDSTLEFMLRSGEISLISK